MATSTSTTTNYWSDSVFFFSYDEGGGPYDHVPPVPGYSNQNTDATSPDGKPFAANIPDIGGVGALNGASGVGGIAVNPDTTALMPNLYFPCAAPSTGATIHCDLTSDEPGYNPALGQAPTEYGFAAQLGFRLPNIVISPFSIPHYVAHTPMDHTAVIKFVENRFIGPLAHLTNRDAAQPDLLEFFNFNTPPWAAPPTPPTPYSDPGPTSCTPSSFGQP
jgi:phospholipase C